MGESPIGEVPWQRLSPPRDRLDGGCRRDSCDDGASTEDGLVDGCFLADRRQLLQHATAAPGLLRVDNGKGVLRG